MPSARRLQLLARLSRSVGISLPLLLICIPAAMAVLGPIQLFTALACYILLAVALALAFRFARHRARTKLKSCELLACLNCAHDLRGLGRFGRCPECGQPFDADECRRRWGHLLAVPSPAAPRPAPPPESARP